ncbi:hypothetical protein QBC33DRAFT_510170 [Phialemonium atrogriseum]|uniref:Zn(2)-C6 fungal-type domain-containing protein n=1 Tax=Phialemonium atrogriseum TaxID=1093897 RepID=A0AAJ0FTM0_9PEZI|nr:uncharacterized protein QBC33DRAFT_510170 [Phialemonium atrogriseum]KAK1772290.1 hypothetical protein QBC33DRAFT_510170 [Phialemonium atrogriseum]
MPSPSLKRGFPSSGWSPEPAPKRRRSCSSDACDRCKTSKIKCVKTESGRCEKCIKHDQTCMVVPSDGRTNHAVSRMLELKVQHFKSIYKDYCLLMQVFGSDAFKSEPRRRLALRILEGMDPGHAAAKFRALGATDSTIEYPRFIPIMPEEGRTTLLARKKKEGEFSRNTWDAICRLHKALLLLIGSRLKDDRRRIFSRVPLYSTGFDALARPAGQTPLPETLVAHIRQYEHVLVEIKDLRSLMEALESYASAMEPVPHAADLAVVPMGPSLVPQVSDLQQQQGVSQALQGQNLLPAQTLPEVPVPAPGPSNRAVPQEASQIEVDIYDHNPFDGTGYFGDATWKPSEEWESWVDFDAPGPHSLSPYWGQAGPWAGTREA